VCRLIAVGVTLAAAVALVRGEEPKAATVPDDFKLVALFGPGYSDLLPWKTTITADGKVLQNVYGGRRGGKESKNEAALTKDDVAKLAGLVEKADFFKLKPRYAAKVTDQATLTLEVTANKQTHKVAVYGQTRIQGKEDRDAVDRFLSVWGEVLRKVPAPNPGQTADKYKPGNYRGPK
jgi:hypothetical protein